MFKLIIFCSVNVGSGVAADPRWSVSVGSKAQTLSFDHDAISSGHQWPMSVQFGRSSDYVRWACYLVDVPAVDFWTDAVWADFRVDARNPEDGLGRYGGSPKHPLATCIALSAVRSGGTNYWAYYPWTDGSAYPANAHVSGPEAGPSSAVSIGMGLQSGGYSTAVSPDTFAVTKDMQSGSRTGWDAPASWSSTHDDAAARLFVPTTLRRMLVLDQIGGETVGEVGGPPTLGDYASTVDEGTAVLAALIAIETRLAAVHERVDALASDHVVIRDGLQLVLSTAAREQSVANVAAVLRSDVAATNRSVGAVGDYVVGKLETQQTTSQRVIENLAVASAAMVLMR